MAEYSLSSWKKNFGDVISLFEKEKKKYEEQRPEFPKNYIETFKGGKFKQTLQRSVLPIADYILSFIYAAQTGLCLKDFHYLPNLFGLKRIRKMLWTLAT